jgi:hypothetical protein
MLCGYEYEMVVMWKCAGFFLLYRLSMSHVCVSMHMHTSLGTIVYEPCVCFIVVCVC